MSSRRAAVPPAGSVAQRLHGLPLRGRVVALVLLHAPETAAPVLFGVVESDEELTARGLPVVDQGLQRRAHARVAIGCAEHCLGLAAAPREQVLAAFVGDERQAVAVGDLLA